jgi:hypothetical protein
VRTAYWMAELRGSRVRALSRSTTAWEYCPSTRYACARRFAPITHCEVTRTSRSLHTTVTDAHKVLVTRFHGLPLHPLWATERTHGAAAAHTSARRNSALAWCLSITSACVHSSTAAAALSETRPTPKQGSGGSRRDSTHLLPRSEQPRRAHHAQPL